MSHTHRCVADRVTPGAVLTLSPEESHHLVRVSRRSVGDEVEVIDSAGGLWPAKVVATGPPSLLRVGSDRLDVPTGVPITLVVGLAEYGRLDTLVEKATELGITAVRIMSSKRVRRVPDSAAFASRRDRMVRVAQSAAKQCGRPNLPDIDGVVAFDEVVATCDPASTILVDPTGDRDLPSLLVAALGSGRATVIVGPDAGLDAAEVAQAAAAGIPVARLGEAVLRTETAALVVAVLAASGAGTLAP